MSMVFRPWVRWGFSGDEEEFSFRHPMEPWTVEDGGVGGHAVASAGIAESYRIREDEIARVVLRVEEDELPTVRSWLRWARRSGQVFQFRFDQTLSGTEHGYWIHEPVWPEPIVPERDPEFEPLFRLRVAFRREVGPPITTTWAEF